MGEAFRGRYWPTIVVMVVALCPELIVSSGAQPLQPLLLWDLHVSRLGLELGSSLSDAGYALGAVVAVDLVQRFSQRPLFIGSQIGFAAGAVLCAVAPNGLIFGVGRAVDGLAVGLLLVLALPPLVTTFGARHLPTTMTLVNVGLFGAAAAGPLVSAAVASSGGWRALFAGLAVVGAAGAVLSWRTLPERDAMNPDQEVNGALFPLAVAATVLPFFGAAQLTTHPASAPVVWLPLAVGVVALAVLVTNQYRRCNSLIPVEKLCSTLPLAGTGCAMVAGAVFVLCLQGVQIWLSDVARRPPADGLALLWPAAVGVALAAVVFGRSLRTRLLVAVIAAGLSCLVVAAVLLAHLGARPSQGPAVGVIALLLGLGAGMTVAPGLFTAALSLPSDQVARAVGVVELLRAEAAFLLGPVVTHIALFHRSRPTQILAGVHSGAWVGAAVGVGGLAGLAVLLLSGQAGPQRPDLDGWLDEGTPALTSPQVALALRSSAKS